MPIVTKLLCVVLPRPYTVGGAGSIVRDGIANTHTHTHPQRYIIHTHNTHTYSASPLNLRTVQRLVYMYGYDALSWLYEYNMPPGFMKSIEFLHLKIGCG